MLRVVIAFALLGTLTGAARLDGADWAEFRGPGGAGRYDGPPLVTEWGPETNVAWKTHVPGLGWSSPIVVKDKLFLTTAVPLSADKQPDYSLRALCLDAKTGSIVWDVEVFVEDGKGFQPHKKNSHASPTPVSDGERVYVHFGHQGTACLDFSGKVVWKTRDHKYVSMHGNGGSPVLVDDKLVYSGDGQDKQFVIALDAKTGAVRWKTDRKLPAGGGFPFSFSTPLVTTTSDQKLIVSPASNWVAAYDTKGGQEVWRAKYPQAGWSVIPQPVAAAGLLFVSSGFPYQRVLAIDPAGTGDITSNVKWENRKLAHNTPTPVAEGGELYVVADSGMMSCFDAKTGAVQWSERLRGKAYSASPLLVNGLIYVTSEEGVGQVMRATKTGFEELSKSDLKEKTFATFVPADGALFVRTESTLYRFDKK